MTTSVGDQIGMSVVELFGAAVALTPAQRAEAEACAELAAADAAASNVVREAASHEASVLSGGHTRQSDIRAFVGKRKQAADPATPALRRVHTDANALYVGCVNAGVFLGYIATAAGFVGDSVTLAFARDGLSITQVHPCRTSMFVLRVPASTFAAYELPAAPAVREFTINYALALKPLNNAAASAVSLQLYERGDVLELHLVDATTRIEKTITTKDPALNADVAVPAYNYAEPTAYSFVARVYAQHVANTLGVAKLEKRTLMEIYHTPPTKLSVRVFTDGAEGASAGATLFELPLAKPPTRALPSATPTTLEVTQMACLAPVFKLVDQFTLHTSADAAYAAFKLASGVTIDAIFAARIND